jgi:hypothetical protein
MVNKSVKIVFIIVILIVTNAYKTVHDKFRLQKLC